MSSPAAADVVGVYEEFDDSIGWRRTALGWEKTPSDTTRALSRFDNRMRLTDSDG